MQLRTQRLVERGIAVRPHHEEAAGRNHVSKRDDVLSGVGQAVGQAITGQIDRGVARVVELEPVTKQSARRISHCLLVRGHHLVNGHFQVRVDRIVGRPWRG